MDFGSPCFGMSVPHRGGPDQNNDSVPPCSNTAVDAKIHMCQKSCLWDWFSTWVTQQVCSYGSRGQFRISLATVSFLVTFPYSIPPNVHSGRYNKTSNETSAQDLEWTELTEIQNLRTTRRFWCFKFIFVVNQSLKQNMFAIYWKYCKDFGLDCVKCLLFTWMIAFLVWL